MKEERFMGKLKQKYKLVLFDMDGTLINGRTIFVFAEKKGFANQLAKILDSTREPFEKSIEIAKLLKGISYQELLNIFRKIPLQDHIDTVIPLLKERQIKTALVTDGYQPFANDLKKRLGLDYAFANRLIIKNQVVTGDFFFQNRVLQRSNNGKIYSICKRCVLDFLCMTLDIAPSEVVAIGDGSVDIDMIEAAGLGIAYRAPEDVRGHADVATDDLRLLFDYIQR
jgi:phosphoserine phosphatase SerB